MMNTMRMAWMSVALLGLSACASTPQPATAERADCLDCGEIIDIAPVRGGAAGALGSGSSLSDGVRILDSQPLSSSRLDALTGRLGLSPLTRQDVPVTVVRSASRLDRRAQVTLRMDRGGVERIVVEDPSGLRVGDRVKRLGLRLVPAPEQAGGASQQG